jgi:prevent-host-death family protein
MGQRAAISVAEAKRRLSDLLGRVAYGKESFLITKRGRPMAVLSPAPHKRLAASVSLADDHPLFAALDEIVQARHRHRFRAPRRRR